jgi:hypothetical protein
MDYLLRTTTESAMLTALKSAGLAQDSTDYDGSTIVVPTAGISIDHIGPIPPTVDINGVQTAPGDARWHTNIRSVDALTASQLSKLSQVSPPPTIPYRVFA